jgi:hypothetical protein
MSESVSMRWKCDECGGDVALVEHVATDASATESFDCVDCDATGDVHFSTHPDSPRCFGSVVPK